MANSVRGTVRALKRAPRAMKKAVAKKVHRAKRSPVPLPVLLERLQEAWPEAHCELNHRNAFELLVATILSAQCTDVRVNLTTPALFAKFPTPEAMAGADPTALETLIKSTGFFRNKAKSILGAARRIVSEYGGRVPDTMEEILTLPGVARKTASVVLGNAYGKAEGIAVDTHVMRLTQRWKITKHDDPKNIEIDLMKRLPRDRWTSFSHQTIFHGRRTCYARSPDCGNCMLADLCPSAELAP